MLKTINVFFTNYVRVHVTKVTATENELKTVCRFDVFLN